jgi:hypothetical protein
VLKQQRESAKNSKKMEVKIRHTKVKTPNKTAFIRTLRNEDGQIVSTELHLWLLDSEKQQIFERGRSELSSDEATTVDCKICGHWGILRTTIKENK